MIVGNVNRLWARHPRHYGLIPSRGKIFFSTLKYKNGSIPRAEAGTT
jgi:hypothetical protein